VDITELHFAQRMNGLTGSAIREIFKYVSKPGVISFAGGNPGAFALPHEDVARISGELLRSQGKTLLQYGATEGYFPLRESLVGYIEDTFQARFAPQEIVITSGSMQGLDLLCKALINPGDVVLAESPTFVGALQCLNAYQAQVLPLKCDDTGIDPDHLEEMIKTHHAKMLYTIPTFQNPTGITLSLERRKRIAGLAAKYGVVVAEDDPYHSLRYTGEALPSIKSFDTSGWVVLLGSFSKVIAPGLRVGFMAGSEIILRRCVTCKQCADVHTANLNQAIVDVYLRQGLLTPHIRAILPGYGARMACMLEYLSTIPQIRHFTKPEGGLFIFVSFDEDKDVAALFNAAIGKGVAFVPGSPFYPEGGHKNTLRLNFSSASLEDIKRGMDLLNQYIQTSMS
jgi:2-aminoadipate transaminase